MHAQASIDIPASPLDQALRALAREAGIDVASSEPGLGAVRARAVHGRLSPLQALRRLLADTGYRAVPIDPRSFRIERAPLSRLRALLARPRSSPPPVASASGDVVVTASKQSVPLLSYPGSLQRFSAGQFPLDLPEPDLTQVAHQVPVLQSTDLGPGRNKVFIRGIADSSFNGATQSTASVYLGDVQIGFSEQNPDIKLYDMAAVEVLEGPQGTLYGSGAIGGIIRLIPNPVDLDRASGTVALGGTATRGGAPGYDGSAVIDLPISAGTAGLRAVGYREDDGGWINDPGRNRNDVNRVVTDGGRATLAIKPGDGWSADLGGLWQRIDGADAQYADARIGPLARRSSIAQPFHNSIGLGSVTITRTWESGLQLVSVTGVATYHSADVFDATPGALPGAAPNGGGGASRPLPPLPQSYVVDGDDQLISHETRLSRSLPGGASWVTGIALLDDRDSSSRAQGPLGAPTDLIGVTNVTRSASAFAEATAPVTPALALTLGGRVTEARTDSDPSFKPRANDFVRGRSTLRFDPTMALVWRVAPDWSLFARAQTGFRTGGLAVARGVGRVADFAPDSIRVGEVGIRKQRGGAIGLSASADVSYAYWSNIQADLVNRRGLPFTSNIGDARIWALEGNADWIMAPGLRATGSFLYTDNRVEGALAQSSGPGHRRLPDTPALAATGDLAYERAIGAGVASLGATASYTGRSVLGTGDLLDLDQGAYAVLGARARWRQGAWRWTLDATNLLDAHANLFAMGNPFQLADRALRTPLRPTTLRLGAAISW